MLDPEIKTLCERIISECLKTLSLGTGVVSHIENGTYQLVAVESDRYHFSPGEILPLKDSYCREVFNSGQTIGLINLRGELNLCKHPLYEGLPLDTYIGTPIYKNGNAWGTLNFSSMLKRPHPFTAEEIRFIEAEAAQISRALSSQSNTVY